MNRNEAIDYDLEAALEHNDHHDLIDQIEGVVLELTGEGDEREWYWIVQFKTEPRWGYITGGCDYTGWD